MKKSTKLVVLVAALTALFAITAFAKTGWASDETGWYYVGTDGDKVEDAWRTYGGKSYWLGDDGYMVTNSLVDDDKYYVGEDGARVTSAWVKLAADEDDESGAEYRYRYATSSGFYNLGGTETAEKKINGKYYLFDTDGLMLFGYVKDGVMINDQEDAILECDRYCGAEDDGAEVSGWYHYEDGFSTIEEEDAWFYFASRVKTVGTEKKLISKKYYSFDANGVMLTGWACTYSDAAANDKIYYNEDGSLKKSAWVYTTKSGVSDSEVWFYLDSAGKATLDTVILKSKKYYALNANGVMKAGLIQLTKKDGATSSDLTSYKIKATSLSDNTAATIKAMDITSDGIYYFSGDAVNDGAAKTGTIKIDLADAEYTFNFEKGSFKATHGLATTGYVYDHGMLISAGSSKYALKDIYSKAGVSGAEKAFVDGNGKLVTKAGKYADADATYYVIGSTGKVLYKVTDKDYPYTVTKTSGTTTKYATSKNVAEAIYNNIVKGTAWPYGTEIVMSDFAVADYTQVSAAE